MKKIITLIIMVPLWTAGIAQLWIPKIVPPFGDQSGPGGPLYSLNPVSFTIDSIVYVYYLADAYDYTSSDSGNFYAYHPATDTWVEMANFPGQEREGAICFSIGNYGYLGAGENLYDTAKLTDFYQYNPSTNTWTAVENFPGISAYSGSFAIGSLGYAVGGYLSKKCYQYNPAVNQWTQKSDAPFYWNNPFSKGTSTKGYCGFGSRQSIFDGGVADSIFEYDPTADSWTAKANIPGGFGNAYISPKGFCINNKIYIANNNTLLLDIFDIASNTWTTGALFNFPAIAAFRAANLNGNTASFSANGLGYIYFGSGSSYLWQYNPAWSFSASYTASDSLCPGNAVTFTIASNINFSASNYFKLQFFTEVDFPEYSFSEDSIAATGPGTYTLHVPYWVYYGTNGYTPTQITVSSTNPIAEAVFDTTVHELKAGLYAPNITSTYSICNGTQLNFSGTSGDPHFTESYSWSDASGVFDTSISVTISPSSTTTYYLREQIQQTGCARGDTFIVIVDTIPSASLSFASYNICPSASISLGGTTVSGYTYNWADGNGFTSTIASPVIGPSVSDVYYLTVTDTSTGCLSYATVSVATKTSPAQTICLVTVDSTSSFNIITWEKLDREASDSFYIYRETSTNNYTQIGAIEGDSLSVYEDFSANPNMATYRYKIAAMDTCGNTGVLSPYHNTILLQYVGSGELIWNTYDIEDTITPVSTFDVMIDPLGTGDWDTLISVPGTQSNVQDINFASHTSARYRVLANFSYPCTSERSAGGYAVLSNIADESATAINQLQENHVNLFPNPATIKLYIQYTGQQPDWIILYDVSGQQMSETKYTEPQINIAMLSPGIYFIEIRTAADTERYRFVKM